MNADPNQPAAGSERRPPLLICGPTAVGKTDIALELASRLTGEIVSVDSMQVYRGMDIGTAKPTAEERSRVPHHLLDVAGFSESFDAAAFIRLATQTAQEIRARGRLPIFCGGTGLYFKAYLYGLSPGPSADPGLRTELRRLPIETLLSELARLDPATYERIDRQNPRRIIRAVEVIRITGKPLSEQRSVWQDTPDSTRGILFGLSRAPGDLHRRIEARVDAMFQAGLVEETSRLLQQGLDRNIVAMQALGYRQVVDHLQGKLTLPQTIELVKIRTRQFARRQMTWFRRQLQVRWIHLEPAQETAAVSRIQEDYHAVIAQS